MEIAPLTIGLITAREVQNTCYPIVWQWIKKNKFPTICLNLTATGKLTSEYASILESCTSEFVSLAKKHMDFTDNRPITATIRSLLDSTILPTEIIVVDRLLLKKCQIKNLPDTVPIKIVPPHETPLLNNHSSVVIAGAFNTAIIHCRTPYIWLMGSDTGLFAQNSVQKIWEALSSHRIIFPTDNMTMLFDYDEWDTDLIAVEPLPEYRKTTENTSLSYVAMSVEDILALNGFEEMFDGEWGGEDIDLANRVRLAFGQSVIHPTPGIRSYHLPHAFCGSPQKKRIRIHELMKKERIIIANKWRSLEYDYIPIIDLERERNKYFQQEDKREGSNN